MLVVSLLALVGVAAAAPTKQMWQPAAGTTWQIVLSETMTADKALKVDAQAYDLDMFNTDKSTIDALHAKGKFVICYFSAGSYEPNRPDSSQFQSGDLGSVMDGWPDEKWLQTGNPNVRKIMTARINTAASKGCDAVDPDNVDGYGNSNGVGLTEDSAVDFVKFLAKQANANGMSMGLKNAGDIVPKVLDSVQFSVNEQCHQYSECDTYQPFIAAGKPVFNIEYPGSVSGQVKLATTDNKCYPNAQGATGFSTVLKNMALDASVKECEASAGYQNPAPKSGQPGGSGSSASAPASPPTPVTPAPDATDSSSDSTAPPSTPAPPPNPAPPSKPAPSNPAPPSKPAPSGGPAPGRGGLPGRPGRPGRPATQDNHGHRKGSNNFKQLFATSESLDGDDDGEDNETDDGDSGDNE